MSEQIHIYAIDPQQLSTVNALTGDVVHTLPIPNILSVSKYQSMLYILTEDGNLHQLQYLGHPNQRDTVLTLHTPDPVIHAQCGKNTANKHCLYVMTQMYEVLEYPLDFYNQVTANNTKLQPFTLYKRKRLLAMFQRECLWYIVSQDFFESKPATLIDIYDYEFGFLEQILLDPEYHATDVQMRGRHFVYVCGCAVNYFDIITRAVEMRYDFELPLDRLIVSNELCGAFMKDTAELMLIRFEKNTSEILPFTCPGASGLYFSDNDTRFNLSPMYTPFVHCVPLTTVAPLLAPALENLQPTINVAPQDDCAGVIRRAFASSRGNECNGYQVLPPLRFPQGLHIHGVRLPFFLLNNAFDTHRHLIEVVKVTDNMTGFLLYKHPVSGLMHAVPDIEDAVKLITLSTQHDLRFEIASVRQPRTSILCCKLTPRELEALLTLNT